MGKMSFADEHRIMTEITAKAIKKRDKMFLEAMEAKHQPLDQNQGAIGDVTYCKGCMGPNGVLATKYPCDVVKVLRIASAN